MRVIVDYDRCDGMGLCAGIAPEIFELDDDMLHLRAERPADEHWPVAEEAARACPKLAITLLETS
ncbi:ferredoxin [Streptosporangium sp. CA-135522]|uniref:ferredoxin n=1 Tax=Streptosporangium sp. CA-135522 TaxID=3240072 RepID=UPI003D92B794